MGKKFFLIQLVFAFHILFLPQAVFAAQLLLDAPARSFGLGDRFDVALSLNTEDQSINTLEGTLAIPANIKVVRLTEGSSIIPFWLTHPELDSSRLVFSGIIPGGFEGRKGKILTVTVETLSPGAGKFVFSGSTLLNDGKGTSAQTKSATLSLAVTRTKSNRLLAVDPAGDHEPPESFTPVIARDPAMFDGDPFLSFVTVDKFSGLKEYEVVVTPAFLFAPKPPQNGWQRAESPLRMSRGALSHFIFVKAIDNNGNERLAMLPPEEGIYKYKTFLFWGILIVLTAIALYVIARR